MFPASQIKNCTHRVPPNPSSHVHVYLYSSASARALKWPTVEYDLFNNVHVWLCLTRSVQSVTLKT